MEHAILVAQANDAVVSPIAGRGSSACVVNLGIRLAEGRGGTALRSIDPANEVATFVGQRIENACRGTDVASGSGEQLRVFDDSDAPDDQFDVFVDDRVVFRAPVAEAGASRASTASPPAATRPASSSFRTSTIPPARTRTRTGPMGSSGSAV